MLSLQIIVGLLPGRASRLFRMAYRVSRDDPAVPDAGWTNVRRTWRLSKEHRADPKLYIRDTIVSTRKSSRDLFGVNAAFHEDVDRRLLVLSRSANRPLEETRRIRGFG
jgi:hypothetical protein